MEAIYSTILENYTLNKKKEKNPGELMSEITLHVKNCVQAVRSCHKGGVWNESDLPTFEMTCPQD